MRLLLLSLGFASLAFISPVRAEAPGDDEVPPVQTCGGCVASGHGTATWNQGPGAGVTVTATLTSGRCKWVDTEGCMEIDCSATASVTWWGQAVGTTLKTTGGDIVFNLQSGNANVPAAQVDCNATLAYTFTLGANALTVDMACSNCKRTN